MTTTTPSFPEHEIKARAAELTIDERQVLCMPEGTVIPEDRQRVHWDLCRREILRESERRGYVAPVRLQRTELGEALLAAVRAGIEDDAAPAWGILHRSKKELCWWRADASGYHTDVRFAGLYTRKQALEQHGRLRAGRSEDGRDEAIPPAKMLALVAEQQDAIQRQFDELGQQHAAILRAFEEVPP